MQVVIKEENGMKAEQIKKVVEKHRKYINIDSRTELEEMIAVCESLLEEEIKDLKENHPEATRTLNETKIAREVLRNLWHEVDDMDTDELVKQDIWND